jgi:hypothetical protein
MEAFQALPILQTPTKSFVLYSFEHSVVSIEPRSFGLEIQYRPYAATVVFTWLRSGLRIVFFR